MLVSIKYIKTRDRQIVVFGESLSHSQFKSWGPISAGFLKFCITGDGIMGAYCYGRSDSLGIDSELEDSNLANEQLLNTYY